MVRNSRFRRDWKKSHSQSILKKWMSARLIHFFAFHFCWWIRGMSHWRECVSVSMEIGEKRVFEDDVFRENTCLGIGSKKTQDEIYADIVLNWSRGSPGQWFPETEYLCASAIFIVGTSGIPPNLSYRSVGLIPALIPQDYPTRLPIMKTKYPVHIMVFGWLRAMVTLRLHTSFHVASDSTRRYTPSARRS